MTLDHNIAQYNTTEYNPIQQNRTQQNRIHHNTTEYNATQHNTTQLNTTEQNEIQQHNRTMKKGINMGLHTKADTRIILTPERMVRFRTVKSLRNHLDQGNLLTIELEKKNV